LGQFDAAAYEKFLIDNIKVEGKTGQLGEVVTIAKEGKSRLVFPWKDAT
jgi:large subunit ribosomal protein L22e